MKKDTLFGACLIFLMWSYASSAPAAPGRAGAVTESNIVYQDWHDGQRGRDLPIKIYLPKTGNAPFPVVIFSHGLGGSREDAGYLGDYWSQRGYLCVFVLNELERRNREDPEFKGRLQLAHIALAGHSFGAGTTLAIAGQNFGTRNMRDDRIKAAIYLCPPVSEAVSSAREATYGSIKIPGLLL